MIHTQRKISSVLEQLFSLLPYFWWYKHKQQQKDKSQLNTEILLNLFIGKPAVGDIIVKKQVSIFV